MLEQVLEQQEFLRRQRDVAAAGRHDVAVRIDRDRAISQRLRRCVARLALRAPQQRAHAGDELVRAEWLRKIIVGAELEPDDPLRLLGARGQHDEWNRGGLLVRAQTAADLETVDVRQHQIEHHQSGRIHRDHLQRVATRCGAICLERGFLEVARHELRDVRIVLDDQDARGHRRHSTDEDGG